MRRKRTLSVMLALSVGMSLTACGGAKQAEETKATEKEQLAGDLNNDGQIEMGQNGVEVEVNVSDVHMDAADAFAAGKWEALFTPVDIPGRFVDMENFDLTLTEEEKAAMEKEPAYGKPVLYYMSDGCTFSPTVADDKGYYEEAGLIAEGFKGNFYIEALGTQQATVAVGHIATMERGEISAALLSDTFAYVMMKEGKLKCVRSLQDEDFAKDSCCVIAMNRTFVKENPVISKKITQAVQKAHSWLQAFLS